MLFFETFCCQLEERNADSTEYHIQCQITPKHIHSLNYWLSNLSILNCLFIHNKCDSTICAKPVLATVLLILKVTYPTSALPSLPYKPIIWISSPQVWSQLHLKMNVFATHCFPEKSWASGLLLVKNLKEQVAAMCLQFLSWNEIKNGLFIILQNMTSCKTSIL